MRAFAVVVACVVAAPASAAAEEIDLAGVASLLPPAAGRVSGEVVAADGRFTADGRFIVTDVTIRTVDGTEITATQPGGFAEGYGQISVPGPRPLEVGERVSVLVRDGLTGDGAPMRLVETVEQRFAPVDAGAAALPYVRTGPSKAGRYTKWAASCVNLLYHSAGTTHIAGDREFEVLDDVVATWIAATQPDAYLDFVLDARSAHEVGRDAVNVVLFRELNWCRPPVGDMMPVCHNAMAAGITLVTFIDDEDSDRDGEIVDADIELNGFNFAISDEGVTAGEAPCLADLGNTFTHELGHLMGLDHVCRDQDEEPEIDHLGNPVPFCSDVVDPAVFETTMYPSQSCGETKKRSPEADDILAIRSIYPAGDDPGECSRPSLTSPGCCTGDVAARPREWLVPLLMIAFLASTRRAREAVIRALARRRAARAARRTSRG